MEITEKLIRDIVEAEYTLQQYCEDKPIRPVPGPPATTEELTGLEEYLHKRGLFLPPSYRAFLTISNGLEGFRSYFSLLNAKEVMIPPNPSHQRGYPSLSRFIIGTGNSLEFVAFDPDKVADSEMEVVSVADDGEESRYPDFNQYLHMRLGQLLHAIELERADRKGLKD